jgi:hypothetical protein
MKVIDRTFYVHLNPVKNRNWTTSSARFIRYGTFNTSVFRAGICKPFQERRNRFPAWRPGTTTLFVVPAIQATWACGIVFLESIPGLLKRL